MCETPQKFRHELKYYITESDRLVLRSRLKQIARHDRHADENGVYHIRSLYFETPDDKVLNEKLTGVMNREKFRIRLYNLDTTFIRLEKKIKINNATRKISCRITQDETEKLIHGDLAWMPESNRALILELYTKMKYQQLRAKTIVDYDRESFTYAPGNVRITIDSNIRTGINSTRIFDADTPMIKPFGVPVIILEIKYDNYLPSIIKEMVQLQNRRVTAFSKYAASRMFG